MAMVVTRVESSSPLPKEGAFANPKGKGKKKTIAFKAKQETMGIELVKRKEPEDVSQRKKQKANRAKLTSKKVSSGVEGSSTSRVSSSIAIQVFDHVFCIFFFFSYNFCIVTVSITICIICDCRIGLSSYVCFIVMLV